MPVARYQLPDGRIGRFEVPDGTTPEQAQAMIEAQLATVPQAQPTQPTEPPKQKWRDVLKTGVRELGRGGRNVAQGALALPAAVGDLLNYMTTTGYDPISGQAKPSRPFSRALQALDSPELADRNAAERFSSAVTRGIGGAGTSMGLGGAMAGSASPAVAGVGQTLANPALQTSSNVAGALSSQAAAEAGADPIFQALAGMAGGAVPGIATGIAGGLTKTPQAQQLLDEGVDLTPGQLNPQGGVAQIERAWQRVPVVGPAIKSARTNAENQWREAFIKKAAAPGAKIQTKGDITQVLDEVYDSFTPAYDKAKGFPLVLQKGQPVIVNQGQNEPLSNALRRAVADKNVAASNASRAKVSSWVMNQLTKPFKNSEDLLNVRSAIRAQMRKIKGSTTDDLAERDLYENAEATITKALESQLPKKVVPELRKTDAQYAKYKVAEDAVYRGGDAGFTPFKASQSVKQASDKGQYARGGGGEMRDLASAGGQTFAQVEAQTGASLPAIGAPLALMAAKPEVGIPLGALMAGGTLTQTGRRLLAGQYPFQQNLPRQNLASQLNLAVQPWAK